MKESFHMLNAFLIHPSPCVLHPLLRLFVTRMQTATTAELLEFEALRRRLLILRRHVITALAFRALKHNVISCHNSPSFPQTNFQTLSSLRAIRQLAAYSTISEIVPAPTVLPPSRMAKRSPFSIAIGVISVISIATLSPGITISTPSGNVATPVTSVVRK